MLDRILKKRKRLGDPRVIDQNVATPKLAFDRIERRIDRSRRGHVKLHSVSLMPRRAQRTGKILRGMRIDIADKNDMPRFRQLLRNSRANTSAAASNQRDARMSKRRTVRTRNIGSEIHSELSNV